MRNLRLWITLGFLALGIVKCSRAHGANTLTVHWLTTDHTNSTNNRAESGTWNTNITIPADAVSGTYYFDNGVDGSGLYFSQAHTLGTANTLVSKSVVSVGARNITPATLWTPHFQPTRLNIVPTSGSNILNAPMHVEGDTWGVNRVDLDDGGGANPAITKTFNYNLVAGATVTCPDRPSVTFSATIHLIPPTPGSVVRNSVVTLVVDGVTKMTASTGAGILPGPVNVSLAGGPYSLPGHFAWAWKVDGVTQSSGTVGCYDEITGSVAAGTVNVQQAAAGGSTVPDGQASQPVPSGSPPADGNTNVTTAGGGNQSGGTTNIVTNLAGNGGGGGPGGNEITGEDIYAAVRQALMDAGNSGTYTAVGAPIDLGAEATYDTSKVDGMEAKMTTAMGKADTLKSGLTSKVSEIGVALDGLPVLSTVTSINLGSLHLGGGVLNLNADLTPFLGILSTVRALILFMLQVMFVVKCGVAIYESLSS